MSKQENQVDNRNNQKMMSLLEHLVELKDHLVRIAIAMVICGAASFFFADKILNWILLPLLNAVENYKAKYGLSYEIIATEPTTMIGMFMKISLFSGAIIAMPFIVYQVLLYVLPALTRKEKQALYIVIPSATLFFLGGAAFAYFVMVPAAIPFLLGFGFNFFGGEYVSQKWQIDKYLPFLMNLIFWVGVSFETPLIMAFVARLGVVTAKQFLSVWKFAVVGIAILSALITPTPDPFNMGIVMAPLIALYFLGVLLARLMEPKQGKEERALAGAD